jgi:hypothetical protein
MHIPTPCSANWDHMTPAENGRHCSICAKIVVDLTALPIAARRIQVQEIASAIANGKPVCVRSLIDRDGRLAGSRRILTGGMAIILAMTVAGCQGDGPEVLRDPAPPATHEPLNPNRAPGPATRGEPALDYRLMGDVCAPPPSPLKVGKPGSSAPIQPHANS